MAQLDTPTQQGGNQVRLTTIALVFGQVGITAFGMAVMVKLKSAVLGRHWLTVEQMNEGLALVQLYPGPIMIDFTAYVGYKLRGARGALAATVGFVTPSLVLMVALSALYFAGANLGWVHEMILGLDAIVVGVVLHVTLDFAKQYVVSLPAAGIALGAFVADLYGLSPVVVVIGALAIGAVLIAPGPARQAKDGPRPGVAKAGIGSPGLSVGTP